MNVVDSIIDKWIDRQIDRYLDISIPMFMPVNKKHDEESANDKDSTQIISRTRALI